MGGILHLVEDRPTPPSVYNWRVYVLALVASCGSNMIGYTSAFIGTTITLTSFKEEFGLDKKSSAEQSLISENIVSLFIAGAFFGALLTYGLSHWLGRKVCLMIASATFALGSGLQCGANHNRGLGILYAGRVLTGLGTGVASNIVPIYLSELAPPAIRGRLVGLYELGWQIGGMLGFWINVSQKTDRYYPFEREKMDLRLTGTIFSVWRGTTPCTFHPTMDHSIRYSIGPVRYAVPRIPLDPGIAPLAFPS